VAERERGDDEEEATEADEAACGRRRASRSTVGEVGERSEARWRLPDEGRARRAGSARLTMAEVRSRARAARASKTGRLGTAAVAEEGVLFLEGEEEGDDAAEAAAGGRGGEAGVGESGAAREDVAGAVAVAGADEEVEEVKIEFEFEVEGRVEEEEEAGSGGSGGRRGSRRAVAGGEVAEDGREGDDRGEEREEEEREGECECECEEEEEEEEAGGGCAVVVVLVEVVGEGGWTGEDEAADEEAVVVVVGPSREEAAMCVLGRGRAREGERRRRTWF
jgi:hypothetical protein